MIFSELYNTYYNTVAGVIRAAQDHALSRSEIEDIISRSAFGESVLSIEPALLEGRWQLLLPDGTTPLSHAPTMPPTLLQRRWIKAVCADPRMRLFMDDLSGTDAADPSASGAAASSGLDGITPLFRPEDVLVFDSYNDGDPYEDKTYIRNFRAVLDAVRNKYPLEIDLRSRKDVPMRMVIMPEYIEYSEKDDKFRLVGRGRRFGNTVNIARIVSCRRYNGEFTGRRVTGAKRLRKVVFELTDERNALERALLHFAHFDKEAERLGDDLYRVTVKYDRDDETELVIRILSFGPMVRVVAPDHFVELIRERLLLQKSCGLTKS